MPFVIHGLTGSAAGQVLAAPPAIDLPAPASRSLSIDDASSSPRTVWPQPGFMLDTAQSLSVNYIISTAQTTDGMVWIGGLTGLQRYDGVRLHDARPAGKLGAWAVSGRRLDVHVLHEVAEGLLHNWGSVLVLRGHDGAPDRVSRPGGPRWQDAASFEWRDGSAMVGSHCLLEDGSVLQARWDGRAALMRMDMRSGQWRAVPGFDAARAPSASTELRCAGDWAYWVESAPQPRTVAMNLRDRSWQQLAAPPSLARAVVDMPQNRAYAALLGDRRLLVGQDDGLYVADFQRGHSGIDADLTRRVRELLPDETEGGSFRVMQGSFPGQVWITRSGSRAVEYQWTEPQRLTRIDTAMMSGRGLAGQTSIRRLSETRHGSSRTLWVGRGDWLQAILLSSPVVARSGRPRPDERADASDEVLSLCMGGDGSLWLTDIQGHLSLVGSTASAVMQRVRGGSPAASLLCECDQSAWWLEGDTLVHGTRVGPARIESLRYALPAGQTRGTDVITRLAPGTLAIVRPDRLIRVHIDATGHARATTTAMTTHAGVRFQTGTPGPPVALVIERNGSRLWIYRSADDSLTPVTVEPAWNLRLWDAIWLDTRHAIHATHEGRTELLEFSDDLRTARSRPLGDESSMQGRTLYDLVGNSVTGIWGSTTDGLVRLDMARGAWEPIGAERGVAWSDYNWHANWVDPKNQQLGFGGLAGWTLVDVARPVEPQDTPRAVIDHAAAGHADLQPVGAAFTLQESDALLRVQASAAGNAVQRPTHLEYRIEGVDPGWRRIAAAGTIEYVSLAAGRYELQARFVSAGGIFGEAGHLHIEVLPPWWRSATAKALFVILLLGVAWRAWRWRQAAHEGQLLQFRETERSAQRLSLALSASSSVLWDEVDGVTVRTDAAWLGYGAAELSGDPARFEALIHPDDVDRYRTARRKCREHIHTEMRLEYRVRHREGVWVWVHDVGRVTQSGQSGVRLTGTFHEITRIKIIEEELRSMAFEDGLTRLPNRRECYRQIDAALGHGESEPVGRLAVVFMDLDRFKHINDSMGHAFGDRLLVRVAAALRSCLPAGATAFRLGGDEFVILLCELPAEAAVGLAQRVLAEVRGIPDIDGVELNISASLGVALHPEHGCERKDLLQYADAAMYEAKQAGRNVVKVFDPGSAAALLERPHIEAALRQGVDRGEFELVYQPKVDVAQARCIGFEALLRWRNKRFAHVGLARTIGVLESSGLIDGVGQWALRRACQDLMRCEPAMQAGATVAVNVSVRQLARPGFGRRVAQLLAELGLPPNRLELELTESIFAADDSLVTDQLRQLRAAGIKVSLDDFGMGYSSLSYLGSLPIDVIKIDKFFVDHIDTERRSADLCRAILALAASLDLAVVAEGVERAEQAQHLEHMHCTVMQGFLFSRPVAATDMASWFGEAAATRCTSPRRGAALPAPFDADPARQHLRLVSHE